jgi:hypothetical protein
MKIKRHSTKLHVFLIVVVLFILCNEIYRYLEVSRLREHGCRYAAMGRRATIPSTSASRRVREFLNFYHCEDGVERTSIYRIDRFIRPWEYGRPPGAEANARP